MMSHDNMTHVSSVLINTLRDAFIQSSGHADERNKNQKMFADKMWSVFFQSRLVIKNGGPTVNEIKLRQKN